MMSAVQPKKHHVQARAMPYRRRLLAVEQSGQGHDRRSSVHMTTAQTTRDTAVPPSNETRGRTNDGTQYSNTHVPLAHTDASAVRELQCQGKVEQQRPLLAALAEGPQVLQAAASQRSPASVPIPRQPNTFTTGARGRSCSPSPHVNTRTRTDSPGTGCGGRGCGGGRGASTATVWDGMPGAAAAAAAAGCS